MGLYLVRHAKAGQRGRWDGPDHLRPLTKAGVAQAQALATWLANFPVPQILSSPYVRCIQTVEPLAAKLDVAIEVTEHLSEAVPFEPALERLHALPEHSVLCTHGDLLPDLIEALVRRGAVIDGPTDWRKGTTWVLTREDGVIARAHAVPPPDIDQD